MTKHAVNARIHDTKNLLDMLNQRKLRLVQKHAVSDSARERSKARGQLKCVNKEIVDTTQKLRELYILLEFYQQSGLSTALMTCIRDRFGEEVADSLLASATYMVTRRSKC